MAGPHGHRPQKVAVSTDTGVTERDFSRQTNMEGVIAGRLKEP